MEGLRVGKGIPMQRFALVLSTLVALASAADAVSIAVAADQASYLPGQTITLTVTVDTTGGTAQAVFGRIQFDPLIMTGGSPSQNQLTSLGGVLPWYVDVVNCGAGFCDAFNQQAPTVEFWSADQGPGFVLSTLTFTAGAPGATNVTWSTALDGFQLDFFGLTNAPGTTVTVVPEPTTAALLAAGLVALGAARARARS